MPAGAEKSKNFVQGGFKYTIGINTTFVEISDAGLEVPLPISDDSTLVIPSVVEIDGKEYAVESMAYASFACRPEVKHLVISEGIRNMGAYAFYRCTNLVSVQFPSTFASLPRSPYVMFDGCCNLERVTVDSQNEVYDSRDSCNAIISTEDSTLVFACLGTKIPSGITTIGQKAFSQCEKMENIVIPEGVKTIEASAFSGCPYLRSVSLPNSLERIGYNAFFNCMSLESITIPQNVSEIIGHMPGGLGQHWNLFGGCYNLKEVKVDKRNKTFDSRDNCNALIDSRTDVIVAACGNSTIPKSAKGIGAYAFTASSIASIKIPKNITRIEDCAFWKCEFCTSISVAPDNPVYNSKDNCNAIIETATGKLLQGCGTTTIPDNVREIGNMAFYGNELPPYLIIPDGVEVIGEEAFMSSRGLKYVKMPSTLKLIKKEAFSGCRHLEYVDMSGCSPQISEFAFSGCERLGTVDFSSTTGDIHKLAFSGCPIEKRVRNPQERYKCQNE